MICRRVLFPSNVQSESDNLAVVWLRLNWIWNSWRPGKDCNEFIVVYLRRFVERKKILWGFVLSKILTKWLRFKQTKTQKKQKNSFRTCDCVTPHFNSWYTPRTAHKNLICMHCEYGTHVSRGSSSLKCPSHHRFGQPIHAHDKLRKTAAWFVVVADRTISGAVPGSPVRPRKVFAQMDKNSDGKVHCGEFVSWLWMDHDGPWYPDWIGGRAYGIQLSMPPNHLKIDMNLHDLSISLQTPIMIYIFIYILPCQICTNACNTKNFKNNYIYIGIWIYMYTDLYPNLSDLIPLFIIVQYMFNTCSHAIDWRRCRTS